MIIRIDDDDIYRGDPADHVLGRSEEKAARVHAVQPPKPRHSRTKKITQIRRDIVGRIDEISPAVAEYELLLEAAEALKEI